MGPPRARTADRFYRAIAKRHGLAVTGGSDYHADQSRDVALGRVTLPPDDFERLQALATHAARH